MNIRRWAAVGILFTLGATGCADSMTNPEAGDPARGRTGGDAQVLDDDCGLPVGPESDRVDLITPVFSNPTDISNPLFPAGELQRAVFGGMEDGERLRTETTLLPGTKTIEVNGVEVEAVVSQYVAWLDRRIEEVALDWYAEDDEGNVWYLGEDVFNYDGGEIANQDGTWITGGGIPPAMIMPADPEVGDLWRPENACPIVFEEVTAIETGVTVPGPRGPVTGALIVEELHMDGGTENKVFAPGYGEFSTGSGANLEAVALAIPVDALPGDAPEALEELSDGAGEMVRLARRSSWKRIAVVFDEMKEEWDTYHATGVPPMLAGNMNDAMESLEEAVALRDREEARQAAIDVALAALDFELQYEDREEIDLDLIELWTWQLRLDTEVDDEEGVLSDLETLRWVRARLDDDDARGLDHDLRALASAARARDDAATSAAADRIGAAVDRLRGRPAR